MVQHRRTNDRLSSIDEIGASQAPVYAKKPQRYSKDNKTAHLTARSDKSVANTQLYSEVHDS